MVEIDEYVELDCPLCGGNGLLDIIELQYASSEIHAPLKLSTGRSWNCPACDGYGVISKTVTIEIDLSEFGE